MTSIIKVNTFQDTNGNALFNSDGSGNVTLSAGAMKNTPLFKVRLANNQTISDNTATVVAFDSVYFDTGSNWDNTNKRYVPDEAGYYFFFTIVRIADTADFSDFNVRLRKNGSTTTDMVESNISAFHFEANFAHSLFYMNGSSDYVDVTCRHNKGSDAVVSAPYYTFFQGYKLIGA